MVGTSWEPRSAASNSSLDPRDAKPNNASGSRFEERNGEPEAGVAELADALDLGSSSFGSVGSSPSARTRALQRGDCITDREPEL